MWEADVVKFVSEQDIGDVRFYLSAARDTIPELEAMFKAEAPTLEFSVAWGVFQLSYGYLAASCFREGDAFDNLRMSISASNKKTKYSLPKRKFVAGLLKTEMDAGGTGKTIYHDVAKRISTFIAAKQFPEKFGEEWFVQLLDPKSGNFPRLRATYNERHLGEAEIRALAALHHDDIPSI